MGGRQVDENRSEQPKIKGVDRRKFSSDGDPLDTSEQTAESPPQAPPPEDSPPESVESVPKEEPAIPTPEHGSHPSQLFLELVTMLAGQAELLLVGAEDLPAQPAEAQRMINYLGVLEEKTSGNLTEDEAKLLSGLLYQLRTFYLQRK